MIVLEHTFPLWAIVLIIALALVLGLFTAWRFLQRRVINAVLVFFYVLILAGMTWCMLLPGLRNTFTQVRKPRFIVALDTSQSMALTPAPEVPSRWKVAQEALKRPWFSALAGECEVEFFPFDVELSENTPI